MHKEATAALVTLLQGRIPEQIPLQACGNEDERRLADTLNRLIRFMGEIHDFIYPLSRGELLGLEKIGTSNLLASPFKELHSQLVHLVWQAQQVAQGDYRQRVDFMGEFSEAFNSMVVSLEEKDRLVKEKIEELEEALHQIRKLEGVLPICANCKRIRLEGYNPKDMDGWRTLEEYIEDRSEAKFTHSICPDCLRKLYPEFGGGGSNKI
jgi:hypothetical protein